MRTQIQTKEQISTLTYTEDQAAAKIGIARLTLQRLRLKGEIPHCKFGDRIVYLERHIEEILTKFEQRPTTKKGHKPLIRNI